MLTRKRQVRLFGILFGMVRLKVVLLFWLTALICIVASPSVATLPPQRELLRLAQTTAATAQQLEQQGRSHYTAGDFTAAAAAFQQAVRVYQTAGNSLKQAIALSNLALADQQLGLWREANQAIADSLMQLELGTSEEHQFALAQVLDIQATLQFAQGQPQTALSTWERAAQLYQQIGRADRLIDNQINQAQALQALGFIDGRSPPWLRCWAGHHNC